MDIKFLDIKLFCGGLILGPLLLQGGPFAPAAGQEGSEAVHRQDTSITGWLAETPMLEYGEEVETVFRTPGRAIGPSSGSTLDVVSLGRGGRATLHFPEGLADGPGWDFAVFGNSFDDFFLELAWVEVSSDGVHFVRFPGNSLTAHPVGPFGSVDPREVEGFAGKYRVGYGTPFDLSEVAEEAVRVGVDLQAVRFIRLVDVVGDGRERDSAGRPVYDPFPTVGSAGFDLEAVAWRDRPRMLFPGLFALAAGWRWDPQLGYLFTASWPWVFGPDSGWFYVVGETADSIFLYLPGKGWCWSGSGLLPLAVMLEEGGPQGWVDLSPR